MKCAPTVFAIIAGLASVQGALGKSTPHAKNDDNYIARENDLASDAPMLPIEGGLQEPRAFDPADFEQQYDAGNSFDSENPYENAYNLERFYDVDNPFYMGNSYFTGSPYFNDDFDEAPNASTMDLPEGTIISESNGDPIGEDSLAPEEEDERAEEQTPFMMGIPAQLQGFMMYDPQYYRSDYDDYAERVSVEMERHRKEKEDQMRDSNVVNDEHSQQPQTRRVRRGLSKSLHLRNKIVDGKGLRDNSDKENVVLNSHADCGPGRGREGGRRGGGNGGVDDVTGAASDAADAVENAAENLRLTRRRTGGRQRPRQIE